MSDQQQQVAPTCKAYRLPAEFAVLEPILNSDLKGIVKDFQCGFEVNAVFPDIQSLFIRIPVIFPFHGRIVHRGREPGKALLTSWRPQATGNLQRQPQNCRGPAGNDNAPAGGCSLPGHEIWRIRPIPGTFRAGSPFRATWLPAKSGSSAFGSPCLCSAARRARPSRCEPRSAFCRD